ncbi:hypothetical protein A7X67_01515 [Clostridium sp. W14A]|nr:hypothetical protein A7X67_01515 [Clostridium sp. W14A]
MEILKSQKGEMAINSAVIMLTVMLVVSFGLHFFPFFVRQQEMITYANEICRVAAISGRVGEETDKKEQNLNKEMNIRPNVEWSTSGNVQLAGEIRVTCSTTVDIGNFGGIASVTIPVSWKATDQSEVYWK